MTKSEPYQQPHRRYNPLRGDWILVSPHRTARPWQGQAESVTIEQRPAYDPGCYLCPGNRRASNAVNPKYESTYVFENDFSALLPEPGSVESASHPLFVTQAVQGVCRVLCFSPRHDLTLGEMTHEDVVGVIDAWASETEALGRRYRWVQVFENRGAVMGCSNPHPHGQIWATTALPNEAAAEDGQQRRYRSEQGRSLLLDVADAELKHNERVVCQNDDWLCVIPFWASWPYETLVIPLRPVARLPDLSAAERSSLGFLLRRLLKAYDSLFDVPFPYSMGWHGAPFDGADSSHFQLHAHFYPPLLRSATVKKFMVGYEMLAEPQRDFLPEEAAARLAGLVPK